MDLMAAGVVGRNSCLSKRLSCVTSCTPRAVNPEPIHPMTPRYIIRMDAPIRGAKELPKTSTKSDDPVIDGLLMRNMKALMNVKASKPMPIKRMIYAVVIDLSFTIWTSSILGKMPTYNIKYYAILNNIQFNYRRSPINDNLRSHGIYNYLVDIFSSSCTFSCLFSFLNTTIV